MSGNSQRLVSIAALLLAAVLSLASCHDILGIDIVVGGQPDAGQDAGPDGPPGPLVCSGDIAQKDAWECITRTVCDVARKCINDTISDADCQRANIELFDGVRLVPGNALVQNAIAAGTLRYQSTGLVECLAHLNSVPCFEIGSVDPFDACRVFSGTVPDGGSCFTALECKDVGAECVNPQCGPETCCAGVCRAPAKVGEDCAVRGGVCELGAYCIDDRCSAGNRDDPCFASNHCDEPFWCSDGVCIDDVPNGSDCVDNAACPRPESCVGLDFPKSSSGRCAKSLADGDPCDGQCDSRFTHYCDLYDPNAGAICKRRGKLGEQCDPSTDSCQFGLRCGSDSLCESRGDVGDVCNTSSDCKAVFGERFCDNELDPTRAGLCAVGQPDGAICFNAYHCASGACEQGSCVAFSGCYP